MTTAGSGRIVDAGASRVVVAEQEIAIAAHEIHRHARFRRSTQLIGDEGAGVGWIVVADPCFEQVAEDVQRVALRASSSMKRPNRSVIAGRSASRCRSEMNSVVIAPF